MSNTEQTLIMVKVDGGQCLLAGKILGRFERRGYKIFAFKMTHPLEGTRLTSFMSSGNVVAILFEGRDVVKQGRAMFGIVMGQNICHVSDSVETAKKEIGLLFTGNVIQYGLTSESNIYE
ncbi:nucleoside diphosphate kinase [Phakopsora pachyrhizi]|uniref:Nucleoside diphosphate kinase n=1 Tax=Phakopsora pachyrhizi TaxID=170000 RepID=A0AAV0BMH8_PHAPC|nr:nucleoside diphosphate kinase [Phakopsora pachyrhizi]CAH7688525.1 nucleoside diphosphate kinase [Phakopsora pachyrhizi]